MKNKGALDKVLGLSRSLEDLRGHVTPDWGTPDLTRLAVLIHQSNDIHNCISAGIFVAS